MNIGIRWERSGIRSCSSLSLCKAVASSRYKIVESDSKKCLQVADLDTYLLHALQKHGVKLGKGHSFPERAHTKIEKKLKDIERQSLMGISCAITQSWLIEDAATQVEDLEATLKVALSKEDFANLLKTELLGTRYL
jgi:hypothetical protein